MQRYYRYSSSNNKGETTTDPLVNILRPDDGSAYPLINPRLSLKHIPNKEDFKLPKEEQPWVIFHLAFNWHTLASDFKRLHKRVIAPTSLTLIKLGFHF